MKKSVLLVSLAALAAAARGELDFNAGADLRVRQELLNNVPYLSGDPQVSRSSRSGFINHVRFRPRVWGEITGVDSDNGVWRLYTRLTDEFRWCPEPYGNAHTFPDELILDNLFLEGRGIFDGLIDFRFGRQDLYNYCGLDHVFVDGTPGDGSRSLYTDMAAVRLHVTDESTLDVFALYNFDRSDIRWGTDRSRAATSLTGLGSGAEPEMDDWGFGAIWGSNLGKSLPYQIFVIQKNTRPFTRSGVKHPRTQRETIGAKVVPRLNEEWSLQLEGMGQVGENGNGDALSGWSSYAGVNWKSVRKGVRPFGKLGYHFMSGDDDAGEEDGGHSAWDPIWSRGVNDSELFLYGTHYGTAWWSNQHYLKLTLGLDLGARHSVQGSTGPLFAAAQDGLGGGDGMFKGYLSQLRYDFPLFLGDPKKGERLEIFGNLIAELFNPGDYFETEKPAWYVRWQIDVKF